MVKESALQVPCVSADSQHALPLGFPSGSARCLPRNHVPTLTRALQIPGPRGGRTPTPRLRNLPLADVLGVPVYPLELMSVF